MTYPMSAILGFVQGVAEFLPISSSGHLTLFQHFFGLAEPDNLFNVLLHFATLLAVCIYYFQDVAEMIVEFFEGSRLFFPAILPLVIHRRRAGWSSWSSSVRCRSLRCC